MRVEKDGIFVDVGDIAVDTLLLELAIPLTVDVVVVFTAVLLAADLLARKDRDEW